MEIKKRCELLLRLIRKEFEDQQKEISEPVNTTGMSDTQHRPKAIGKRRATAQSVENGGPKRKSTLD